MTTERKPSLDVIEKWLEDSDCDVRVAAMNACNGREVPIDMIEKGLEDSDCDVRAAAMNACNGREVPIDVIEKWLEDSDWHVRVAAMKACNGQEVPLDVIEKWLEDSDWRVRDAAMNACNGREVPIDMIENGLEDSNWHVRIAAMNALQAFNIPVPVIRTIEPPELVYKKCIGGIIVVASIPKEAQVRGGFNRKCRASKAVIKQIIGDLCGEPVGVSKYDLRTLYYAGDEVKIDNFDFSDKECSTGFHFFCTMKEARNY